jgi:hypothetical protein
VDIEVARDIVRAGFRSVAVLGDLLPKLKEHCPPDEYKAYSTSIAAAINSVMTNTVDRAIGDHPGLRAEIEDQLARHGRYS